jgi:hypothetical protein
MAEEARKSLESGDELSREIKFSSTQKNMFTGFSENFYGNNWFVPSNNEGGKTSAICGVLEKIPKLSFKTELVDGPATKMIDKLKSLTQRGSIANTIGSATGANVNPQISGDASVRLPMKSSFQSEGFKLEFTCWKKPEAIFDPVCLPSDMQSVIKYLTNFATVETNGKLSDIINKFVEQGKSGLNSIGPIIGNAVSNVKATINDAAKKNVPGYSFMAGNESSKKPEDGEQTSNEDGNWIDAMAAMGTGLAEFVDSTLVRRWSDKQRITHGKTKFNETLHRLDIMRAGVLDTYLIVAINDWEYQIDQSALGERMKVSISCMIDQRMSRDRLRLYSDRSMFG